MNDSIHILNTCLMLSCLWAFWHYGWKTFALDQLRQNLFTIRGELFDLAARQEHGASFENLSYIAMRQMINSRIRFAHRISFVHIYIGTVLCHISAFGIKEAIKNYKPPAEVAIEILNDGELKKKLNDFNKQTNVALLKYLLLTSPILLTCTLVTFVCVLITILFKHGFNGAIRLALGNVARKEFKSSVRAVGFQADTLGSESCPA
jgi:hypothetical protein